MQVSADFHVWGTILQFSYKDEPNPKVRLVSKKTKEIFDNIRKNSGKEQIQEIERFFYLEAGEALQTSFFILNLHNRFFKELKGGAIPNLFFESRVVRYRGRHSIQFLSSTNQIHEYFSQAGAQNLQIDWEEGKTFSKMNASKKRSNNKLKPQTPADFTRVIPLSDNPQESLCQACLTHEQKLRILYENGKELQQAGTVSFLVSKIDYFGEGVLFLWDLDGKVWSYNPFKDQGPQLFWKKSLALQMIKSGDQAASCYWILDVFGSVYRKTKEASEVKLELSGRALFVRKCGSDIFILLDNHNLVVVPDQKEGVPKTITEKASMIWLRDASLILQTIDGCVFQYRPPLVTEE